MTDKAIVLVYNPEKDSFVRLVGAAVRSALTCTMVVPSSFMGDEVHVYMSFVSESGKDVSNSVYLAAVTVV